MRVNEVDAGSTELLETIATHSQSDQQYIGNIESTNHLDTVDCTSHDEGVACFDRAADSAVAGLLG